MNAVESLLFPVVGFLGCPTPDAWLELAQRPESRDLLLIDHANCEKKAAGTALSLMFRYTDRTDLLMKMSRLAREELRHFEQVLAIMKKRGIDYVPVSASRYAGGLARHINQAEPAKLVDKLIIGAFIEARSCERFARLAPLLDEELHKFYLSLLKSESRHYQDYLALAQSYADFDISDRVNFFQGIEAELINQPDSDFRFHSGPVAL